MNCARFFGHFWGDCMENRASQVQSSTRLSITHQCDGRIKLTESPKIKCSLWIVQINVFLKSSAIETAQPTCCWFCWWVFFCVKNVSKRNSEIVIIGMLIKFWWKCCGQIAWPQGIALAAADSEQLVIDRKFLHLSIALTLAISIGARLGARCVEIDTRYISTIWSGFAFRAERNLNLNVRTAADRASGIIASLFSLLRRTRSQHAQFSHIFRQLKSGCHT